MNNFFPHDSNARNSDKLIPVRVKMGAEGYGIYFMLLERLREEPGYMSVKDYNMLAFDLRVDAAKVKAVVENFGLFVFTDDGKYFYSEGFTRRMQVKDEKSRKARDSIRKKWGVSSSGDEKNSIKRSERLSAARKIATHTKDEWEELKSFFGHCVICGKSSDEVQLVKDHIKPIYQGGSDGISNLQPLCRSCNSRKGPDVTDYRLVFCERNGIEMPTKWLRNAYEMPTNKEEESKEEERKGKKEPSTIVDGKKKTPQTPQKHKYTPYVLLTEAEHRKLVETYGDDGAEWMINKLSNYKEARGMTYKSDYRAILNWVVREYEKEKLYGTSAANRQTDTAATAKRQRDAEFATHIMQKLKGG